MSSFFVIFKINLSAIPIYSKHRIKKKSPCKGDSFPRVGLDKVICTGSSATFQRSFFPLGSNKKLGKLLLDTYIAQNTSPVDCSSHFPRTWKRTCALGWLSGTLHLMRAEPPSSAATAAVPKASKSPKPGERWEQVRAATAWERGRAVSSVFVLTIQLVSCWLSSLLQLLDIHTNRPGLSCSP